MRTRHAEVEEDGAAAQRGGGGGLGDIHHDIASLCIVCFLYFGWNGLRWFVCVFVGGKKGEAILPPPPQKNTPQTTNESTNSTNKNARTYMGVGVKEPIEEELREVGLADPGHERGAVHVEAVELLEVRDFEALCVCVCVCGVFGGGGGKGVWGEGNGQRD